MPRSLTLVLTAAFVAGTGLYMALGVLDQVVTPGGVIRVALLPSWPAFAGRLEADDAGNAAAGTTATRHTLPSQDPTNAPTAVVSPTSHAPIFIYCNPTKNPKPAPNSAPSRLL